MSTKRVTVVKLFPCQVIGNPEYRAACLTAATGQPTRIHHTGRPVAPVSQPGGDQNQGGLSMTGQVLDYSIQTNEGIISGDGGCLYGA